MTLFIAICLFAVIGVGSALIWKPDNPIEEEAEVLTEDALEMDLDLPQHSLDGKIDFSPWKKEV